MNKTENRRKEFAHLHEERISGEKVFSGVLLQVYRDRVRQPDATTSVREWIDHPGAAAVVPVFDDGSTILVRQYRYAVGRIFLEVPAGKCDAIGESPEEVALRELEEETGWRAGRLVRLGEAYPGIGYSNECIHFYLATALVPGARQQDGDEFIEIVRIPLLQCIEMAKAGEIEDMKSALAVRLAAEKLGMKAPGM